MKNYHTDYSKYYKHPYEGKDKAFEHIKQLKATKRQSKGKESLEEQEINELNTNSVEDRNREDTESNNI